MLRAVLERVTLTGIASYNASESWAAVDVGYAAPAAAANATSDALKMTCLREPGGQDGTTPLHLAVGGGHVAAVVILLKAGADDTVPQHPVVPCC